jgi:hypothetical protein
MINEIFTKLDQYYTAFMGLPIEGQVICGVGLLVALAAAKNIWGLISPVRWTAATTLRGVAFLLHRGRKTQRKVNPCTQIEVPKQTHASDIVPFDISTKKKAQLTYDCWPKPTLAHKLTDNEIEMLSAAISKFKLKPNGLLTKERARRKEQYEAKAEAVAKTNSEPEQPSIAFKWGEPIFYDTQSRGDVIR